MNTTSAAQSVTLSNTGNASLSISGISLIGENTGDFAQTNNCGSSVAAGANCTIGLTFTPVATGARNAILAVADNAADSPQIVSLAGTGVQPTPPGTYSLVLQGTIGDALHQQNISVVLQ
jgi:hypothetical protein